MQLWQKLNESGRRLAITRRGDGGVLCRLKGAAAVSGKKYLFRYLVKPL